MRSRAPNALRLGRHLSPTSLSALFVFALSAATVPACSGSDEQLFGPLPSAGRGATGGGGSGGSTGGSTGGTQSGETGGSTGSGGSGGNGSGGASSGGTAGSDGSGAEGGEPSSGGTGGDQNSGGTGGDPGSGGSSGDSGSGGTSGDSGSGGTGGAPSSGGTGGGTDTGGSSGMAGATGGSSGVTGGGAGVGGDTGGGGQGGKGGKGDCAELIAAAEMALRQAQVCSLTISALQCVDFVEDLCGCTVPINNVNSEPAQEYLAAHEAASKCDIACPEIACIEPTSAVCTPDNQGSARGRCVSVFPL